ncbi:hypothetical protein SynWH8101_1800 [Synechococcus sp. WH 8101]|nr:hypothetical protein SynWH8101_1800 [Synechococcus sp. WH 8101]QNI45630.1 hypothetical protein SynRCC2555_01849 [Synechococcus sp. WH 8101]
MAMESEVVGECFERIRIKEERDIEDDFGVPRIFGLVFSASLGLGRLWKTRAIRGTMSL